MALWMLLSTCETESYVGLAWLGQVCKSSGTQRTKDNQIVSSAIVVARTSQEWKVIAHEIGHMFGANHDCLPERCPNGQYNGDSKCCPLSKSQCSAGGRFMMNPTTSEQITDFSP